MNLLPLIDVLVMLIFFAFVTMQFKSAATLNITLPKVETAGKNEFKGSVTIGIDKDGVISFNGKPVSEEVLVQLLNEVKLIDRETGRSSYSLVKELRGGFNAVLWQGMAKLFGHDLKSRYDADGEDMMIEVIVQRIEKGELGVYRRPARTEKAQARLEKRKARLYRKYGLPERDITLN